MLYFGEAPDFDQGADFDRTVLAGWRAGSDVDGLVKVIEVANSWLTRRASCARKQPASAWSSSGQLPPLAAGHIGEEAGWIVPGTRASSIARPETNTGCAHAPRASTTSKARHCQSLIIRNTSSHLDDEADALPPDKRRITLTVS